MPKFRVLAGRHTYRDPNDPTGRNIIEVNQGEVIETDQNLLEMNGPRGFSPKFELIGEAPMPTDRASLLREKERIDKALAEMGTAQTPAPSQPIDKMSEKELREYAADNEIELGNLKDRNQIIAAIKKAMA